MPVRQVRRRLTHGVMVTQQILVLSFQVRVLVGQRECLTTRRLSGIFIARGGGGRALFFRCPVRDRISFKHRRFRRNPDLWSIRLVRSRSFCDSMRSVACFLARISASEYAPAVVVKNKTTFPLRIEAEKPFFGNGSRRSYSTTGSASNLRMSMPSESFSI